MDVKDLEYVNDLLEQDNELREKIKDEVAELDKKTRTMSGLLNRIHSTPAEQMPALLGQVKPVLESCRTTTAAIANVVPPTQFWRWKDMWTNSLRSAVFAATMVGYLETGTLLTLPQVRDVLGIDPQWSDRYALAAEDYLHGVISLVNELSRLAVNAVTMGNFEEPIKISTFVKDIFAGFSMLNLKNDPLRRRYDSLKYDIKKIEEVVYDVSLRKLAPSRNQAS
ncbi:Translin domain-containing protein [Phanerochaete sordida]|uniref:Translin domain-containing protein n=1 Tax=Phanerochaete sordida TaxID=48140 RepID=A0A9P3GKY5_9APHY|nr:Translin domain-containing protein [Phanerochaete sordida]